MRKLKEKIRVNPCPREFCIKVFRRNTTTNLEKNEFIPQSSSPTPLERSELIRRLCVALFPGYLQHKIDRCVSRRGLRLIQQKHLFVPFPILL